jgi:hypothetical protein
MAKVHEAKLQLFKIIKAGLTEAVLGLEGGPGIGKSAIVKAVAKEIAAESGRPFGCIDIRLSQMADASDFVGMPRTDTASGTTVFCKPDWWPAEGTQGILFLDEPNRGAPDVMQGVFQLLTDRRIHTHKLPDGWFIVMAFNPGDDTALSMNVSTTDAAWNSRFIRLHVTHDVEAWMDWGKKNNIHPTVLRFIAVHPELLYAPKESGSFPCPRSWEFVSAFLAKDAFSLEIQGDMIRGMVGMEAAATFISFMDKATIKPLGAKEVLAGYANGEVERDGRKIKMREVLKAQQNDATAATCRELGMELGDETGTTVSKEAEANMIAFMLDLSDEQNIALLKKFKRPWLAVLGQRSPELMKRITTLLNSLKPKAK